MKKITLLFVGLLFGLGLKSQTINATKENVLIPTFKTDEEKKNWIKQNPVRYTNAGGTLDEKLKQPEEKKTNTAIHQAKEQENFPQYIDTGNPVIDKANFEKEKSDWYAKQMAIEKNKGTYSLSKSEKDKWIIANKELYNQK